MGHLLTPLVSQNSTRLETPIWGRHLYSQSQNPDSTSKPALGHTPNGTTPSHMRQLLTPPVSQNQASLETSIRGRRLLIRAGIQVRLPHLIKTTGRNEVLETFPYQWPETFPHDAPTGPLTNKAHLRLAGRSKLHQWKEGVAPAAKNLDSTSTLPQAQATAETEPPRATWSSRPLSLLVSWTPQRLEALLQAEAQ